jgi:hypothetical protein
MSKITLRFLVIIFITSIFISNAFADVVKGHKIYMKNCKICHGFSMKGAAMHTQVEWEELFSNSGEKIIKVHANVEKSADFFNTDNFKNKYKDLRDFLLTDASDSDQ